MVIPVRGGKHKILSVLQSLALLDGRYAKVRTRAHVHTTTISRPDQVDIPMKKKEASAAKLVSIKRRVGYQEADASKKKDKMVVDVDDRGK